MSALISPYMFITHLERVMDANKDLKDGIAVHGISINNMTFADDRPNRGMQQHFTGSCTTLE